MLLQSCTGDAKQLLDTHTQRSLSEQFCTTRYKMFAVQNYAWVWYRLGWAGLGRGYEDMRAPTTLPNKHQSRNHIWARSLCLVLSSCVLCLVSPEFFLNPLELAVFRITQLHACIHGHAMHTLDGALLVHGRSSLA